MWECNENIVVGAIGFVGNLINFDVRDAFKAWKLSGVCNGVTLVFYQVLNLPW